MSSQRARHQRLVDKLHGMGATRIEIDGDRLVVEFPERPQVYPDLKSIEGGKSWDEMDDDERSNEEQRMALWSTDEGLTG